MESLDALNLRANECSFLEIALADVRRYVETFAPENEKQTVLVFPPLNPRNRFLIHTLVQNFFNELNTISIGSSYGRRTVVYHHSLKPMSCGTELGESKQIQNDKDTSMQRAYRTPCERKAQEKLFNSLMPKKTVDKSSKSTQPQRKQCRRPDIPIYVPKARRALANNTVPNINCTTNNSDSTPPSKFDPVSKMQLVSNDTVPLCSKITKCLVPDSFKFVDFTNKISFDDNYDEIQTSFNNVTGLSSGNLPNILNSCNLNSTTSDKIIEKTNFTLALNGLETNIVETVFDNNCDNQMVSKCMSDNGNTINCSQNFKVADIPDFQTLHNSNRERVTNYLQVLEELESVTEFDDSIGKIANKNFRTFEKKENETSSDQFGGSSSPKEELTTEYNANCPHYCLDDSFASAEEKNYYSAVEELIDQEFSEITNSSVEIVKNNEKEDIAKIKNKKKKKILDVDECCWEDLYDKEDDYVHPLLMKEIASTMGKVQVKCTIQDYRSHQTIEERSGDGECIIEVYGFSSHLKTVDLMNQFAEFRKNHFEIIWVDDTHALAVFESPNLADRALNTPFALVKTRPLKNAIKESKLKADSVVPLPATRPKTCTAMARRLVSSALGLKVDISSDRLHAERLLLANAKEKKIRDAQQKNRVWDDA